jgi:hypothetical protein
MEEYMKRILNFKRNVLLKYKNESYIIYKKSEILFGLILAILLLIVIFILPSHLSVKGRSILLPLADILFIVSAIVSLFFLYKGKLQKAIDVLLIGSYVGLFIQNVMGDYFTTTGVSDVRLYENLIIISMYFSIITLITIKNFYICHSISCVDMEDSPTYWYSSIDCVSI